MRFKKGDAVKLTALGIGKVLIYRIGFSRAILADWHGVIVRVHDDGVHNPFEVEFMDSDVRWHMSADEIELVDD